MPTIYHQELHPDPSCQTRDCCPCPCPCPPPPPCHDAAFTLIKRDRITNAALPGARYGLCRNGCTVQTSVSNAAGQMTFCCVPPGHYQLKELQAPAGYRRECGCETVCVDACGNATVNGVPADGYTIYDAPLTRLLFMKRDAETGQPLSGATFRLSDGRTAVSNNGLVDFGQLAPGTYTMQETVTPSGYLNNPHVYQVTVSNTGVIQIDGSDVGAFSVRNTRYPAFLFTKYDTATGQRLSGATFRLSTGQTVTSDSGGMADFGRLAPGTYTMAETQAPSGYQPNPHLYTIVVSPAGAVTVDGVDASQFSVMNTRVQAAFAFTKYGDASAPLAGAEFTLSSGIATISNEQGAVNFGNLPAGTYRMRETVVPSGYAPNSHEYAVTVAADGSVTVDGTPLAQFSVTNTRTRANLSFIKYGDAAAPLAGAEFTLSNGSTAVSTAQGTVNFEGLPAGTYQLRETAAPAGYEITNQVYTVTVAADGTVTVDGTPLAQFSVADARTPTALPAINRIAAGDSTVTGTGITGAVVTVVFPDETTTAQATVDASGNWSVAVPASVTLQANDTVSASQTADGAQPSQRVSRVVEQASA